MRVALVGFALGTALVQMQARLPTPMFLCGTAALGLLLLLGPAYLRGMRAWQRSALAGAAAVLLGFAWAAGFATARLADELPAGAEGRDITLVGTIASLPQPFERGVRFEFAVEHIATPGMQAPGRLQLTWYTGAQDNDDTPPPTVHAGERWSFTTRLRKPHGNANPHGFDYEAWLLERGIRATGYVRSGRGSPRPQLLAPFTWSVGSVVDRTRERIRDQLQRALGDAPYGGVIVALAIGDQRAIDSEDWQVFTRTGVSHLMSISGLHVTMIASLAAWLTFLLWRLSARWTPRLLLMLPAPKAAALGGFLIAFAYCLLAGFAVPAQRTLYMLGVAAFAIWRGWFGSATRVLAIALAVVTLIDPWAALSPGFWLSFGAVALLLFAGQAQAMHANWWRTALATQVAITIGLVPLTLALFQQVSLVGPLANAVAIPVVSFIITPLALLAALLPVDAFAHLAHAVQSALMVYLEWLNDFEWAVWQRAAPPLPAVALAIAGALWLLVPWWWSWRLLGVVWMLPLFLHAAPRPAPGDVWVTVLDVGQGLAVVAQTSSHALLYDTGPQYGPESNGGSRVIIPYLRGAGVNRLDGMVVTHDDSDHTGGALAMLEALPVEWLASPLPATHPISQAAAARARPCQAGQQWEWDGVRFEMLYPHAADYASFSALKDNAQSCVLKISAHGKSVLLPADLEREGEQRMVQTQAAQLRSDVLIAPHHGSRTSSTQAWLDAVGAHTVIFPVGYRNRFRHPALDVVERYEKSGARLLRSDAAGAVEIRINAAGVATSAYRETRPRYWHGR